MAMSGGFCRREMPEERGANERQSTSVGRLFVTAQSTVSRRNVSNSSEATQTCYRCSATVAAAAVNYRCSSLNFTFFFFLFSRVLAWLVVSLLRYRVYLLTHER